ncbi:hypothetical protein TRIP_C90111 [Candidatus Zixiibacteriota bacterium]|nr:hypothetical protein TRIP_C90111 [candidate division Zixibacteria bacterium]
MPVSQKQLIANRLNALKSTGPRTPLGKLRSSRNALKHGLYSKFNLSQIFASIPAKYQNRFIRMILDSMCQGKSGKRSVNQAIMNILDKAR